MSETKTLLQKIMDHYGWSNKEEMLKSEEWAREYSATKNASEALRKLSKPVESGITMNAWFLRDREFTRWNRQERTFEKTGEGPQVLLETGEITSYATGTKLGLDPLTPVIIGPISVRKNIETGETSVLTSHKDVNVQAKDHGADFPDVTLETYLGNGLAENNEDYEPGMANKVAGRHKKRGVIRQIIGDDFPAYARLTIGEWDEIGYFTESEFSDEETLKVVAYDTKGHSVGLKLPIDQVRATFDLSEDDEPSSYKEALEGRPIFVGGSLGVTNPVDIDQFPDPSEVQSVLQTLADGGALAEWRNWKNDDGTSQKLSAVDFTKVETSGKVPRIQVGGMALVDAREERPDEWKFYAHVNDLSRTPWFSVKGDDGFVVFLGEEVSSSVQDKYANAAEELGLDF